MNMFKLLHITTFIYNRMEIPKIINSSRLYDICFDRTKVKKVIKRERRIHYDQVLTCSVFNFWNLIISDISIYIFYYNN